VTKKVTLEEWARSQYETPPSIKTLRRWAREFRIFPLPQKNGRKYYVDPSARYTDNHNYGS
jgi:Excisionase-like protein